MFKNIFGTFVIAAGIFSFTANAKANITPKLLWEKQSEKKEIHISQVNDSIYLDYDNDVSLINWKTGKTEKVFGKYYEYPYMQIKEDIDKFKIRVIFDNPNKLCDSILLYKYSTSELETIITTDMIKEKHPEFKQTMFYSSVFTYDGKNILIDLLERDEITYNYIKEHLFLYNFDSKEFSEIPIDFPGSELSTCESKTHYLATTENHIALINAETYKTDYQLDLLQANAKLSPKGDKLAYAYEYGNKCFILDLNTNQNIGMEKQEGTLGYYYFNWLDNDRLLALPAKEYSEGETNEPNILDSKTGKIIETLKINAFTIKIVFSQNKNNFIFLALPAPMTLKGYSLDGSVSVEEPNTDELKIYPNPAKESIFIELKSNNVKLIEVYDIDGKQVLTLESPVPVSEGIFSISTESLHKGTFLVKVFIPHNVLTGKVIVE